MKDDRLRVPVSDDYVAALGKATYVFAILEWNAVWCCERLKPGFINNLGRKTAGDIAIALIKHVSQIHDESQKQACVGLADEFKRLVSIRNGILHGKPGTSSDNEQRLFRNGTAWTIEMIDNAADQFAACSESLNTLIYATLSSPDEPIVVNLS